MKTKSHNIVSSKAVSLYYILFPDPSYILAHQDTMIRTCLETDNLLDVEIIDVDCGPDDPHVDRFADQDDEATYYFPNEKDSATAFNHFMDIGKGQGFYDDYDGYSYRRGSASREQYQNAEDTLEGWPEIAQNILIGGKVDESLMWYLDDEYVHCKGHQWYRPDRDLSGNGLGCSPSLVRYSRFSEQKGMLSFQTLEDELVSRFPFGKEGLNNSVFMPIDNLGLWWYKHTSDTFRRNKELHSLGHVLHAIQDASVPHHAAGYLGNFHDKYEDQIDKFVTKIIENPTFDTSIGTLLEDWTRIIDVHTPILNLNNYKNYKPALGWNVDAFITWVALNAYDVYINVYNRFKCRMIFGEYIAHNSCSFANKKGEFVIDYTSLRELIKIAVAMSILIFRKAHIEYQLNF
jgi:hypothetical protein